jgi:hypothetical protein
MSLQAARRRGRRRVLHTDRVEGRTPAALVVAGELEVEALPRHSGGNARRAKMPWRSAAGDEAKGCSEEPVAYVEHLAHASWCTVGR